MKLFVGWYVELILMSDWDVEVRGLWVCVMGLVCCVLAFAGFESFLCTVG